MLASHRAAESKTTLSKSMSTIASDEPRVLRLRRPREPWTLSQHVLEAWTEAAAVCLEVGGHGSQVELALEGLPDAPRVALEAPTVDDSMRRTHRNSKPAVEMGAVAVTVSLIHDLTNDVFIEQAVDHTGIDYWLAPRGRATPLFQGTTRLEISGILCEKPNNTVEYRLQQKRERLQKYADERPVKIAVVEFAAPRAVVEHHG